MHYCYTILSHIFYLGVNFNSSTIGLYCAFDTSLMDQSGGGIAFYQTQAVVLNGTHATCLTPPHLTGSTFLSLTVPTVNQLYRSATHVSYIYQACTAGSYLQTDWLVTNWPNQVPCEPCGLGSYTDGPGKTQCTTCSTGHYQNNTGQITCPQCVRGYYQNVQGQSECLACPEGEYNQQDGLTSCVKCGLTEYNPLPAQFTCLQCPSNSSTSRLAAGNLTEYIQHTHACTAPPTQTTPSHALRDHTYPHRPHIPSQTTQTTHTLHTVRMLTLSKHILILM